LGVTKNFMQRLYLHYSNLNNNTNTPKQGSITLLLKKDKLPNGCRMEMENTVKIYALALCRIWNEQPGLKLNNEQLFTAPQKKSNLLCMPHRRRRNTKTLLERTAEMGRVFKTTFEGGFANGAFHVAEQVHGMVQPFFEQPFAGCGAELFLKITFEGR
jgi:hypothetical protein